MDPLQQNIAGVGQLIGSGINKTKSSSFTGEEGVQGEIIDALTLALDDADLLRLAKRWEVKYRTYETKIKGRQNANKTWYLGKQDNGYLANNGVGIASNLLFESVETFLPAALAKNPEPVVWADNSPMGNEIANMVKTMLQYHADAIVLRPKLSELTRSWAFNFIGILKHGWDDDIKDICTEVRNPQNFIFDPNGYVDAYGDMVGYVGEQITVTAERLIELFPKHKAYITIMVDGKLGTDVTYTEWWNDDYCFYTFKEKILDKSKNPHYNYPTEIDGIGPDGLPTKEEQPGNNHFARPKKPYTFLSVFSLQEQPHDITGLIEQNIPNQNRITQREMQIDINLNRANNSIVVSDKAFNQETAKQAAMAMQKGNPILAHGPINEAIQRFDAPGIPDAVFNASDRDKQDLRSIFGVDGLGTTPPDKQKTLGGLLNNERHDSSRIGGGIGDRLEIAAKNTFNWWVQLYKVYYDEPHFAAVLGQNKAVEYIELAGHQLTAKLIVSVTPDSMKPHDELTQMNQAITLFQMGAIGPKTLLEVANFPNPSEAAADGILYKINPQLYLQLNFPDLAQQLQQQAALQNPQMGAPMPGQPAPAPEANPAVPPITQQAPIPQ